ncbi:5-formyltetrahydrofolate cyclo-ligase [hydrothermal vent metagenome]|uniref:5-formyltetrahydrofolate cyclo-ligase n=1 Tax=hydrothermal vent metagenome TaxID=652676 RepID=A0A3B1AEB4_9ZZZZ
MDNKQIRQKIRALRQQKSLAEQQQASTQIITHISNSKLYRNAHNIAVFLTNDNEPDLTPLITHAWQRGKKCYLPVIGHRFESRLSFQLYTPDSIMLANRYGILEPRKCPTSKLTKPWRLDLLLMPLVAFDLTGNRIGMGGGYYDKTLSYRAYRTKWDKPQLMGVAYSDQQVTKIKAEKWDIALDSIATNNKVTVFKR